MINQLVKWSEGNPGALGFLMAVYTSITTNPVQANIIKDKLERYKTIRGTNLYVLYSDLCEKDINKVVILCQNCPDEILEDACNRQDYSGRALVTNYLQQNHNNIS